MNEHGPLPPHFIRRRALIGVVVELSWVIAAGLYLSVFDFGTESGIVVGMVLIIGALVLAIGIRAWWRVSR